MSEVLEQFVEFNAGHISKFFHKILLHVLKLQHILTQSIGGINAFGKLTKVWTIYLC